jgi:hypothetical protein
MTKYLKVWQGTISGSLGGRDDGYPETKTRVIEDLEELIDTYDANADYFRLTPVNAEKLQNYIDVAKDFQ